MSRHCREGVAYVVFESLPFARVGEVCINYAQVFIRKHDSRKGHQLAINHHFLHELRHTLVHSTLVRVIVNTVLVKCDNDIDFAFRSLNLFLLLAVLFNIVSYQIRCPVILHAFLQFLVINYLWSFSESHPLAASL